MKNISLLIPVFLTLGIWSCGSEARKAPDKKNNDSDQLIAVSLASVEKVEKTLPVEVSGVISSAAEVRLAFKTGGIIDRMFVREGQTVKKGQLLATLDATEINANVGLAKLAAEKADRDFARVNKMYADTAATLEQLQNSQTGSQLASENLSIAKFNSAHSKIFATIDGTVTGKIANEGETVGPGNPVYQLSSNRSQDWIVKVGVTDKNWTRLKPGNKAAIEIEAYPNYKFDGSISQLAQSADPQTKLYEVEIRINPAGKRLAPGLFARANILPAESHSYSRVPIEAIVEGNGKSGFVYALDSVKSKSSQFQIKKLPVQIGFIDGDKILITSELNTTNVITAGSAFLTETSTVILH